jgi:hypothetical protein
MNPKVQIRVDQERGCGWRKPGGLYLISGGVSAPCGLLPIPLTKCPTCSCGIKANRGWTWIDPAALIAGKSCSFPKLRCAGCALPGLKGKHGLLWIGGSFYAKPEDWTSEAIRQGVSRRLNTIPTDFKLGETWVLVAHREVSRKGCPECRGSGKQGMPGTDIVLDGAVSCDACKGTGSIPEAAIFHAFIPSAIEYVVKGDETDDQLDRLIKRGITPVEVQRADGSAASTDIPEQEDLTLVEETS